MAARFTPFRFRLPALLAGLMLAAPAAEAHPHEFIDVLFGFRVDAAGRLTGIEVEWRYDPFTSMLILGDLGLDPAAMRLAPAEAPQLQGFDLDWVEGYNGDLWPQGGLGPLGLAGPEGGETRVEEGRIMSRHLRPLPEPLDLGQGPLSLRAYDPEFYLAYTILPDAAVIGGAGCRIELQAADMDRAYAILAERLAELPQGASEEDDFPQVGQAFSDEIRLSCGG